jgi:dihydrofolate synthase/folylpolyglutamate synthase
MQSAGYKTGLYTSPHLREFTERIRINGEEIRKEAVISFVERSRETLEEVRPSFFEATVGMAFYYFAEENVDIAIIETGLGGRLDSTNVITPEVSLITRIGFDHMEFLGDTLELIAGEKAGIIKSGVPVVIGSDQPDLYPIFRRVSQDKGSLLVSDYSAYNISSVDRSIEAVTVDVRYQSELMLADQKLDIVADYFRDNLPGILSVIRVMQKLGWEVTNEHISAGLSSIKSLTGLKGRFQVLGRDPLIIADVSHNEDGILALLKQIRSTEYATLRVIYGAVRDKKIDEILRLFPEDTHFAFTQANIPRAMPVNELLQRAQHVSITGDIFDDVNKALKQVKKESADKDIILITGSTFVVAEIEDL